MKKVLPFVVPPNDSKVELIKFAEELLTTETAFKKASVAKISGTEILGTFEWGLFFDPTGTAYGACLDRDTEGKIIDGTVSLFAGPDGLNWFRQMQQRML